MNAAFRAHMANDGTVEVDIVTDGVTITAGGNPVRADLRDKAMRRLPEHAALVEGAVSGAIPPNR